MEVYIKTLLKDLESEIETLKIEKTTYVPEAIKIIENYIEKLKVFIQNNEFKTNESEINFFKHLKPQFCYMLIYYKKIHQIESEKPIGSIEEKKEHITSHLNNLTRYFKKHVTFYQYIKSKKTFMDHNYFIRSNAKECLEYETFTIDVDFRYCTGFDNRVAVFLAYEKLEQYLLNEMGNLIYLSSKPPFSPNTHYEPNYEKYNLHWTESQSALTELVYALHESKVFNEGDATILEIAKCFEDAFNVKLSNVHRSFLEIKNRKNDRLKFLDGLRNRLNLFIERSFQK
jgi:hypothetical protein